MRRFVMALVVAVSSVIAGCSEATFPEIESGADGAELQRVVDSTVAALRLPGAVVAVRVDGGSEYLLTSGVENLSSKSAMSFGNRFRVGSITKTMIATIALQLVGEGSIALTDSVARWLPGVVPNANRITVRMLLNNTSGVPDYIQDPAFQAALIANPGRTVTTAETLAAANRMTRKFEPGAAGRWEYSNTNFILLGLVIEVVTGMPIEQALQRRIFDRLGLSNTFFATTTAAPPPFSRGYADLSGTSNVDVTTLLSPTFAAAAGAAVSNARDLLIWSEALAAGGLVTAALHADQIAPVPASGTEAYGLGVQKLGAWIGHSGEIVGYSASMFTRPGVGTIVVLVNKSLASGSASFAMLDRIRWAEFGTQ